MHETDDCFKHQTQHRALVRVVGDGGFDGFKVPVTEVAPEQIVDRVGVVLEHVVTLGGVDLVGRINHAREHPPIDQGEFLGVDR